MAQEYESNIYYHPEKWGMKEIASIDWSGGPYSFDMTIVWQDIKTGTIYMDSDSGCSCPCPFENVYEVKDLTVVDSISQIDYLFKEKKENSYGCDDFPSIDKRNAFRYKVEDALREI